MGNRADWGSGGNNIAQLQRSLPRQESGVVYVQFLTSGIANSNGSSGGGTPQIRFLDQGVTSFALGGNGIGSANVMSLLNGPLTTQLIASSENLTASDLLTVLRIDYDSNVTDLWVMRTTDFATFDYANPPYADGAVNQSFDFDEISIYFRQGSIDEIKILRLHDIPTPEDPNQRPPDWIQQYARSADETCVTEWTPSWAQWPNDGSGGFVCTRILRWSHDDQGFVSIR